jgi:hypothetical protein
LAFFVACVENKEAYKSRKCEKSLAVFSRNVCYDMSEKRKCNVELAGCCGDENFFALRISTQSSQVK